MALDPALYLLVLDLAATSAGALTGGIIATRKRVDAVGVAVLCFIGGVGGGVLRDVILGDLPPVAFRDYRYALVGVIATLSVVFIPQAVMRARPIVKSLDAVGVGLFTAVGCMKAQQANSTTITIIVVGIFAATGGGLLRDLLVAQIPTVLRAEVLATAALVGSLAFVAMSLEFSTQTSGLVGGVVAASLRGLALWRGWSVPVPRGITPP